MPAIYKILEKPRVHDLCQKVMALGREKAVKLTEKFLSENASGKILDLGCGTARYAHLFIKDYVGFDINLEYLAKKGSKGRVFVCADSQRMPFADRCFDTVFSVGVFHHIDPAKTQDIVREVARVIKPDAKVLLVDFFYPEKKIDFPGWLVSKLDRGRYVRSRKDFIREIHTRFDIVRSFHIDHSYPYNLNALVLKLR